jgi:hypothetical protein
MARQWSAALAENSGVAAGSAVTWPGGILGITLTGTTPAGAVQIQNANGDWVPITALTFTDEDYLVEVVPAGQIRINVTAGSAVYVYATRVDT